MVQVEPEFSFNISQHALTAASDDDGVGAGGLTLKGVRGNMYFSSYRWWGGGVIYSLVNCSCAGAGVYKGSEMMMMMMTQR